jgi:superfamily II DNA/RNA helicase
MMSRISLPAAPGKPHGLILVPTRELALQVSEVLGPIGKNCGVRVLAVYGGADRGKQVEVIEQGVEIIVATPLRLIDLM